MLAIVNLDDNFCCLEYSCYVAVCLETIGTPLSFDGI